MTTYRYILVPLAALWLGFHAAVSQAQLSACAGIAEDRDRLTCYDKLAGRETPPQLLTPAPAPVPVAPSPADARSASASDPGGLDSLWELRPELKQGIFRLTPYAPLYALLHGVNAPNDQPSSPTRSAASPSDVRLDHIEAKLQLSLKTKLVQNIAGGNADLWFGYTQQSFWQIANTRFSSPFRETDYQPEAILIQPLHFGVGDVRLRFVGLSLTHQSNGRGESLSRSWNRVIGNVAMESGPWSLQVRPWVRIDTATGTHDDNPDIEDFVGRGELVAIYRNNGHALTLSGRHTLRGGDRSRGSGQFDWAFPLTGSIKGHVQVFSGYGENLIDYNHRQTTLGLGVSFFD